MPSCLAGGEWGARINGKQGEIVSAAGDGAGGSPQVSSAQPHAREFPALTTPAAAKSLPFLRGINLASATFGRGVARVYGRDYTYPGRDSVNYFREKGFNLIRLGFRWENLQPTPQAPLSADELSRIDGVIDAATGQGMYVAINPHNYARYFGQAISVEVPGDVFADLWARLAVHYKNNPRVIFDLMNEPNKMPIEAVK